MNHLEPLAFTQTEIQIFTRDNACVICGGHWRAIPHSSAYRAYCDRCKHWAIEANTTSKHEIKRLRSEQSAATMEYRLTEHSAAGMTAEQILEELGY